MGKLYCKDCEEEFMSKGHNAYYCPTCANERKIRQDKEAWVRRSRKKRIKKNGNKNVIESRLAKRHAEELGITQTYYVLWKQQNPKSYRKWMDENILIEQSRLQEQRDICDDYE